MEISRDLAHGIARFSSAIATIVGKTVSVTQPNGSVTTGILSHDVPCQPIVTTTEGRRYAVQSGEMARLFAEHRTPEGDEWLALRESAR